MEKPTVTITTISERAGVSRGTVDKVLHDRPGVSDRVRRRVRAVIEELGYKPNLVARALRSTGKPVRLGIIIPKPNNPFFDELKTGMDRAADALSPFGLQLDYYYSDAIDRGEIAGMIDYLLREGVDGVALRATANGAIRRKIDECADAGIPVVLYDSDIADTKALCFVGENPLKSGRIAGSLMARSIAEQGEIAVLNGLADFTVHSLRRRGFQEVIGQFARIQIVRVEDALEQSVIAYRKTCEMIDSHRHLKGIFVVAGCCIDVCRAIADRSRQREIKVICFNYTQDLIPYVRDRTIDFAISTEPLRQGETVINTLFEYLFHQIPPPGYHIETPLQIGMDQNVF